MAHSFECMTPRKAYRASSCGYTRKIRRASYAGCHSQCEIIRWNIGQNLALLASRDDYDRALARDNLRVWKMRLRVAVSNLARSPRPELPGRSLYSYAEAASWAQ